MNAEINRQVQILQETNNKKQIKKLYQENRKEITRLFNTPIRVCIFSFIIWFVINLLFPKISLILIFCMIPPIGIWCHFKINKIKESVLYKALMKIEEDLIKDLTGYKELKKARELEEAEIEKDKNIILSKRHNINETKKLLEEIRQEIRKPMKSFNFFKKHKIFESVSYRTLLRVEKELIQELAKNEEVEIEKCVQDILLRRN